MLNTNDIRLNRAFNSLQGLSVGDAFGGLKVNGDKDLLMQVLQNLISNAIKYNLADGWIKVDAKQIQNHQLQVTIVNASEEIKEGDRARIFDRFHRGDPSQLRRVKLLLQLVCRWFCKGL